MTIMSERCEKEKTGRKGRKLQRNFHTLMWVDPSWRDNREGTFSSLSPPPLFFCLCQSPVPPNVLFFCPDNRGHGETMQRGKAMGLCASNRGVV